MAKQTEEEFYLEIDRTRQSLEYPSWILDMYSASTSPPEFLLEEYWLDHIKDYLEYNQY